MSIDRYFYGWNDTVGGELGEPPLSEMYTPQQLTRIVNLYENLNRGKFGAQQAIIQYAYTIADTIAEVIAEDKRRGLAFIKAQQNTEEHAQVLPLNRAPKSIVEEMQEIRRRYPPRSNSPGRRRRIEAPIEEALLPQPTFSMFNPRTWCGKARCPRKGGSRRKARGKKTKKTRRSK